MDPNVLIAMITTFGVVGAAVITSTRQSSSVQHAASETAKETANQTCADHTKQISDLIEKVDHLTAAERGCQTLLTLVLARLGALEERGLRERGNDRS